MKHFTKFLYAFLFSVLIFPIEFVSAQFQTGDVFVAVSNGQVQWRKPDGTLVQTLNTGLGGYTTGMAFDTANILYVTNFSNNSVSKFDKFGTLIGTIGSGYSTPESIVFDNASNFYVGNLGNGIRKYDYNGTYLGTSFAGRVDFMDLQADQCTMLRDTEGSSIERHDVCTNSPLTAFATGISGQAYALRILTNGDVLLADGSNIKRFNSAGTEVQSYDATGENSWFALNLDPDGQSFWSADFSTANVYRFNISTGAVVSSFNTGTGGSTVYGLAVQGEITVATQLFIALTPKTSINPINTQHCVTATVTDQNNVPQDNQAIDFVVRGTHTASGSSNTNANGQTQFCYTGNSSGCDTIFATIRSTGKTDTAYKCWDNPLPVELSAFTSTIDGKDVTLNWTTSSEINNSGFDIERKVAESENWSRISFIQGNGSTINTRNYTYTDRNLNSGKYNYRLKQIDFNGNFEYFNLSSEVEIGIPDKFNLSQNYPNPFNPTTSISFDIPKDGNVKLTVFDNSGKLVSTLVNGFKTAGNYSVEFKAENISSGIYFYKLESGNFSKVMKMSLIK